MKNKGAAIVDRLVLAGIVAGVLMGSAAVAQTSRVFVTSTNSTGNLGGLAGADAECQELAGNALLGGTWVAWLSTNGVNAKDRLPDTLGPFVRAADGVLIAADESDLTDGSISNPIAKTETGGFPAHASTWTGTYSDGTAADVTCANWTNTIAVLGAYGVSDITSSAWTNSGGTICSGSRGFYCFEVPAHAVPAMDARGAALLALLMVAGSLYLRQRYRSD